MVQFRDIVNELLHRLRGTRAVAFMTRQSPPPSPAPICPRQPAFPQPPCFPQKRPIRLPPLPPTAPPPAPTPAPMPSATALPASAMIYPRETSAWGAEGGWAPTTSGFETRVFEPPRQHKKPEPQVVAFSIFDDLFDG